MAISQKTLATGTGAVLGGSSVVIGGAYAGTKETVSYKIGDNFLPNEDLTEEWKAKVTKAETEEKYTSLRELFTDKQDQEKINALQKWCSDRSAEIFKSIFSSENNELFEQVEDLCVLKIKEKLGSEWRLDVEGDSDNDEFEKLSRKLHGNDLELTDELEKIRDSDSNLTEELRAWCKPQYERGYLGEKDKLWKLIKGLCSKRTIGYVLRNDVLSKEAGENTYWDKKSEKAKESATDNSLKSAITNNESNTNNKRKALQDWCDAMYKKPFDSKFNAPSKLILDEVKKWCVHTIKDQLDSNAWDLSETTNDDNLKTKVKTLRSYTKKTNDPELDMDLRFIVVNYGNRSDDSGWEELKRWCQKSYESKFKGENDDTYKLVNKFCKS